MQRLVARSIVALLVAFNQGKVDARSFQDFPEELCESIYQILKEQCLIDGPSLHFLAKLPRLHSLSLDVTQQFIAATHFLQTAKEWPALIRLDLPYMRLDADFIVLLSQSPSAATLEYLGLFDYWELDDDAICRMSPFPRLRELNLSETQWGYSLIGMTELSKKCPALESLDCSFMHYSERVLQLLVQKDETGQQLFPRLHSLRMKSGLLKPETVIEFLDKREGIENWRMLKVFPFFVGGDEETAFINAYRLAWKRCPHLIRQPKFTLQYPDNFAAVVPKDIRSLTFEIKNSESGYQEFDELMKSCTQLVNLSIEGPFPLNGSFHLPTTLERLNITSSATLVADRLIDLPSLKFLHLSSARFAAEGVPKLMALERLVLKETPLDGEMLIGLLKSLTSLKTLKVMQNMITDGLFTTKPAIVHSESLEMFLVHLYDISVNAIDLVAPQLKKFQIYGNETSKIFESVDFLDHLASHSPLLSDLDCGTTPINSEAFKDISFSRWKRLTKITLTKFGEVSPLMGLKVLTSLDLTNSLIDNDGMAMIFSSCPRLDSVWLSECTRATSISSWRSESLGYISIYDMKVEDEVLTLSGFPSLRSVYLDLSVNCLSIEGMPSLQEVRMQSCVLDSLIVRGNDRLQTISIIVSGGTLSTITVEGAKLMGFSFDHNGSGNVTIKEISCPRLRHFSLSSVNGVSNEQVKDILKGMPLLESCTILNDTPEPLNVEELKALCPRLDDVNVTAVNLLE